MKKFIVLSKGALFNGQVIREFDNREDAEAYAKLMRKSEDGKTGYYVAEILAC